MDNEPEEKPWNNKKAIVGVAWISYMYYLFFSEFSPGPDAFHQPISTLIEAFQLSVNFWFINPLLIPDIAPVLHPALEGLFNFIVSWGLLFMGFLSDGKWREDEDRIPMFPFLVGTAFVTNVFYLPYLFLRKDKPVWKKVGDDEVTSDYLAFAESKLFAGCVIFVGFASIAWALFGRQDGDFGDISNRIVTLKQLIEEDLLAHSFVTDAVFFSLFQAWLVPDDMSRRKWQDNGALQAARFVPFFGLAYYLWKRPALVEDNA
eukprot:CAMPEP_0117743070 /NCGR_PEP_ID=MMETSP0947-20121206/5911_1 /TAXON_ID=44440 /ORGANISM="Chattonella subsalsa, Strain CCMP2191" /LENGTH=260 /DNA_ID=CAMNT_0005559691 /DNA_START=283 /DNA_END=1068 /DNA_ORIENTATION=+